MGVDKALEGNESKEVWGAREGRGGILGRGQWIKRLRDDEV